MKPIVGPRVTLRGLCEDDIPLIHGWIRDAAVAGAEPIPGSYPVTQRETERFIRLLMAADEPSDHGFVVSRRSVGRPDQPLGLVSCQHIDWRNRTGELGILIGDADLRGRGYGSEAIELLLDFSFLRMGLHRIYLRVMSSNERAIRAYRRNGFSQEGCLRDAVYHDGDFHDLVIMAVLENEFRRATSLVWADPENRSRVNPVSDSN